MAQFVKRFNIDIEEKILKYDGRPFSVDELEEKVKKVL